MSDTQFHSWKVSKNFGALGEPTVVRLSVLEKFTASGWHLRSEKLDTSKMTGAIAVTVMDGAGGKKTARL